VAIIGILLMILGVVGFALGSIMFGDIGIAAWIGSAAAFLSGIGFVIAQRRLPKT
jgi:hypothetical protein